MSRRVAKFRQADVTRAFKAVVNVGIPVERVRAEIDPATGKITVMVGNPIPAKPDGSEWDGEICD